MTIKPNSRLGRYEIRSQLGAGGMGEVYLAHDPKINRAVAIKVLPSAVAADSDRLRRFEQEVQATGRLNHPNILSVYDVETHDDAPYVVYELLEGETLRERLAGGPIAWRKAIDLTIQIAQGLIAASEKGIIHRDLKPDNIFITREDRVKILDFGLAKLVEPVEADDGQSDLPTRRIKTEPGTVMGTVGYMSPEQVKAVRLDHRSDIFSLGVILYEMLSGQPAFRKDSTVETLNAILKEDPPALSNSNQDFGPALERVVMHCLEKNPDRRFQTARDVVFALEAFSGLFSGAGNSARLADRPRSGAAIKIAWVVAGLLLLGFLAALPFAIAHFRGSPSEARTLNLSVLPSENSPMTGIVQAMAISPDGRRLVFVGTSNNQKTLWVRTLDNDAAQMLAGTEGASDAAGPFWSPDSRFIGYFADGKLKKIDAGGGPSQTLCNAAAGRGGTWNHDGVIVFGAANNGSLYRVSAAGGEPVQVTVLDQTKRETSHRWPFFLPDGQHFLFFARSAMGQSGEIFVGSLDSKETKHLFAATSGVLYTEPRLLLFMRDNALMAQRFDAQKLELAGEEQLVVSQVNGNIGALGRAAFSVSDNSVLAYCRGNGDLNQPLWFDRTGRQMGSASGPGLYFTMWLSPDEKQLAVNQLDIQTGANDIWLFDLVKGIPSRFTTNPANDSNPIWSPDGTTIVFTSASEGIGNLYQKSSNGTGNEELLLKSDDEKWVDDWTSDGKYIIYQAFGKTRWDLWVLPMTGDRRQFPFLQTEFNELQARFSPDGKWIAYSSDESGTREIYVQTFPASSGKWRVSTSGGTQPSWRSDGHELYYISGDRKLMAVDVKPGSTFESGVPQKLFDIQMLTVTDFRNGYVATGDGQRFLVNTYVHQSNVTPINILINGLPH